MWLPKLEKKFDAVSDKSNADCPELSNRTFGGDGSISHYPISNHLPQLWMQLRNQICTLIFINSDFNLNAHMG